MSTSQNDKGTPAKFMCGPYQDYDTAIAERDFFFPDQQTWDTTAPFKFYVGDMFPTGEKCPLAAFWFEAIKKHAGG